MNCNHTKEEKQVAETISKVLIKTFVSRMAQVMHLMGADELEVVVQNEEHDECTLKISFIPAAVSEVYNKKESKIQKGVH